MLEQVALLSVPLSLSRSVASSMHVISDALSCKKGLIVTFVNPHTFYLRAVDQGYANSLWHFDMVLADGIGVTLALRWITGETVERQSLDSTSLFHPLLSHLNDHGKSICIIGGKPGVAATAMEKMTTAYPNVQYMGSKDGFQSFDRLASWVLEQQADIVLVGMGAPHQEKFLLRLRQSGFPGIGITCGGFLDQYLENENYYPGYVNRLNLRFLYRILKEPKRLWRRYLIEYQSFILNVGQLLFFRVLHRR